MYCRILHCLIWLEVLISKYMHILVHGKYGPTRFITQHAFFSALRVQCVWFTLSDSPIRTVTYSEPYIYVC